MNWEERLCDVFESLPLDALPYLSWTCRSLRKLSLAKAPSITLNFDCIVVTVVAGRWLLHHGAKLDSFVQGRALLSQKQLAIICTTNAKPPHSRHYYGAIVDPTPMVWFALRNWGLFCESPKTPMPKHVLEFYYEHYCLSDSLFVNQTPHFVSETALNNYVETWPAEALLVIFQQTPQEHVARAVLSRLLRGTIPEGMASVAISRGGRIFDTCLNYIYQTSSVGKKNAQSPRLLFAIQFLHQAVKAGKLTPALVNCLAGDGGFYLKRIIAEGYQISDALIAELGTTQRAKALRLWLRKQVGDDRYARNTPVRMSKMALKTCQDLASYDFSNLSPEGALQVLRLYPTVPYEDPRVQELLSIASKRKKKEAGPAKKRRKKTPMKVVVA